MMAAALEDSWQLSPAVPDAFDRLDRMKDAFIQITAHELRTPLTLVYGYARLIEETPAVQALAGQDAELSALFSGLGQSIRRMQAVINEILTISRIMTSQIDLTLGPVNLGLLAAAAAERAQTTLAERRLTLHFRRDGWPERVLGDADLLALALDNLINNAIKYTPDGGHIYLEAAASETHARVSVRDTGIGVAPEEQPRIFERFHTTSDPDLHFSSKSAFRGGGLGLGLAICRGIIEAHGGRIGVDSPGYDPVRLPGSTFFFELPLVAARHPAGI